MIRKLGMFLNTKHIEVNEGIKKAREWDLDYIQLYAMNTNFNLANISKIEWTTLKESLSFNEIKVPSLAISFGENGIIGTEVDSAIEKFKYITDKGLGLGAKIITAHIGEIPNDEKSECYDKLVRVCYELGDLAVKFGGVFAIETGSEKAIVLKQFLETINSKGIAVNFDPANLISGVNENPIESLLLLKEYIVQTHIKDCKELKWNSSSKYIEVAAGNGELNFDLVFHTLDNIGFDGYNIIERNNYFDELDGMSQSINFVKRYI
ncbi:sugar phosphate isomerase/epimerase family protein [Bacillus mobilis]|uniref:Xylose isomerase-like TIM barrel domain-containing protein n=2 Tax=Bacillus cereus group TaxID=86661 RepID=A0A1C4C2W8_BACCE|nr:MULTISPECIES: sugar phosphate isomerase/epimerase family protein [Bacillus cereus group]MCC2460388.1 sugar phosphate isomerase/epimerase [Bacillus mobilis]MCU5433971.1 sugar phosphate isomerase/epimerase [Bacillus mobilis]MCU5594620.1 sugar phosphate isomerase/epimerase [Bacillus mobilis]MCU5739054.1 sugar phosphate isomerase/epimerase [Bacillus mobilis]MCU9561797.1 sugar phosphate isomerase/epimerase [Bacillus mobilis]